MTSVGIEILKNHCTMAILACELDNEELWEEIDSNNFTYAPDNSISLEISSGSYLYKVKSLGDIEIGIIDLSTMQRITEPVQITEFISSVTSSNKMLNIKKNSSNSIEIARGKDIVKITETKLIAINCSKSMIIIEFSN